MNTKLVTWSPLNTDTNIFLCTVPLHPRPSELHKSTKRKMENLKDLIIDSPRTSIDLFFSGGSPDISLAFWSVNLRNGEISYQLTI